MRTSCRRRRLARTGCSMCLAMNPDKLGEGERSASTSNRNFEGRQGKGGRTHLVSPPSPPPPRLATSQRRRTCDAGRALAGTAAAAPSRRRHRSDHPGRVAEAGRAHRVRCRPFSAWRDDRQAAFSTTSGSPAPASSSQDRFRRRLVAEHAVWALQDYGFEAVVAPGLQRHLPQQLHEERPVPVVLAEEDVSPACGTQSKPIPDSRSRSTSNVSSWRHWRSGSWRRSRSSRRHSAASSRASTHRHHPRPRGRDHLRLRGAAAGLDAVAFETALARRFPA